MACESGMPLGDAEGWFQHVSTGKKPLKFGWWLGVHIHDSGNSQISVTFWCDPHLGYGPKRFSYSRGSGTCCFTMVGDGGSGTQHVPKKPLLEWNSKLKSSSFLKFGSHCTHCPSKIAGLVGDFSCVSPLGHETPNGDQPGYTYFAIGDAIMKCPYFASFHNIPTPNANNGNSRFCTVPENRWSYVIIT